MSSIQSLIKKYDLEGYSDNFVKHGLLDQSEISLKQQDDLELLLGINRLADRKKLFMLLEDVRTRESSKGSDEVVSNRNSPSQKIKRNKEKFGKMYNKLRDQKKKRNIMIKKPIPLLSIPTSQASQSSSRRANLHHKVLRKFLCSYECCKFDSNSASELRKHMKKCNFKPEERNISVKNKNDMIDRLRKEVKSVKIVKDRAEQMRKQEVLVSKTENRKQKVEINKLRLDVTELMKILVEKDRKIKEQQITINRLTSLVDKLSHGGMKEEEEEPTSLPVEHIPRSNSSPSLTNKNQNRKKKLKKRKKKISPKLKKKVQNKKKSPSPSPSPPKDKKVVILDEPQQKEVEEEKEKKVEEKKQQPKSKPSLKVKVDEEVEEEFTVHTVSTPEAFKSSPLIPEGISVKEKKREEVNNIEFEISREITPFVDSEDEDSSDDGMMRFGEDPRFAKEEQEELKKLRRGLIGKRRKSLPPSPKQYEKFRKYYNNIYDDDNGDGDMEDSNERHEESYMRRMNVQPSMMEEESRNHDVEQEEENSVLRRMILEEKQKQHLNNDISRNVGRFQSGIGRDSFGYLGTPTDYLGPDYFGETRDGSRGGGPSSQLDFKRPSSLERVTPKDIYEQQRPHTRAGLPHRRYNIQHKTSRKKKWTFVPVKDQDPRVLSSNSRLHSAKITSYRGNTEWTGGKHEYVVKIDRISGVGFGLKIGLEDSKGRQWFFNANGRVNGPNGEESSYTRRYFRRGDLVGVHFDLETGSLGFSINGKHFGTVFHDLEGTVKPICVLLCSGNIVTLKSSS